MAPVLNKLFDFSRDIQLFFIYIFLANISVGVFTIVFNLYLVELGFEEDFIGLVNALQTIAMAATAFGLGLLLARFGIWRVIVAAVILYAFFATLLSLATPAWMIVMLAILFGGATSFVFSTTMPFVTETSRLENRHRAVSRAVFTSMLATTTGSLIGGWLPLIIATVAGVEESSVLAYRSTLLTGIALAGLGLIPLLLMSREPPDQSSLEFEETARRGLAPLPGREVRHRMLVFITVGGLMSIGGGMIFPFYNVFLASNGASSAQIGMIFALASVAAAIMSLLVPRMVDKVGEVQAVTLARLAPLPLFFVLIASPGLAIATLAHLFRTSSQAVGWSVESTLMSTTLPSRARQAIYGYRTGTWNIGFSIASLAAGAIIVRWGYNPTFAIYIGFMIIAMSLFYFYFRSRQTSYKPTPPVPVPEVESASEPAVYAPPAGVPPVVPPDGDTARKQDTVDKNG